MTSTLPMLCACAIAGGCGRRSESEPRAFDDAPRATPSTRVAFGTFAIDRDVASCDDYDACIAAGACRPERGSCRHAAVVSHAAAIAYCAWRGGHLPTIAQWSRAIRGAAADRYPTGETWEPQAGCRDPTADDDVSHLGRLRCRNTSRDGVTYYVLDPGEIEWTAEVAAGRPVGIDLYGAALDRSFPRSTSADYGELRCAY